MSQRCCLALVISSRLKGPSDIGCNSRGGNHGLWCHVSGFGRSSFMVKGRARHATAWSLLFAGLFDASSQYWCPLASGAIGWALGPIARCMLVSCQWPAVSLHNGDCWVMRSCVVPHLPWLHCDVGLYSGSARCFALSSALWFAIAAPLGINGGNWVMQEHLWGIHLARCGVRPWRNGFLFVTVVIEAVGHFGLRDRVCAASGRKRAPAVSYRFCSVMAEIPPISKARAFENAAAQVARCTAGGNFCVSHLRASFILFEYSSVSKWCF